jgi:hypothetical protein
MLLVGLIRDANSWVYLQGNTLNNTHALSNCSNPITSGFFQEFLRIVSQENSKIQNFEYEVIWRTPIRRK